MKTRPLYHPKGPVVTIWGTDLCIACTELKVKLTNAGWRFKYYEVKPRNKQSTRQRIAWLKKNAEGWTGGLPVMRLNETWQCEKDWVKQFIPWNIEDPVHHGDGLSGDYVWL